MKEPDQKPRIGVSYAWNPEDDETNANCGHVNHFCNQIATKGYRVMRDRDFLKPGDSLSEFMRQLAGCEHLYIFLSKAYLESRNCMYELLVTWQKYYDDANAAMERIHVFTFNDARLYDEDVRAAYVAYWIDKRNKADARVKNDAAVGASSPQVTLRAKATRDIAQNVGDFLEIIADRFAPKDFDEYVEQAIVKLPSVQADPAKHSYLQRLKTPPPKIKSKKTMLGLAHAAFQKVIDKHKGNIAVNALCDLLIDDDQDTSVDTASVLFPVHLGDTFTSESSLSVLDTACSSIYESPDFDLESKNQAFEVAQVALLWLMALSVNEDWLNAEQLDTSQVFSGEIDLVVQTKVGAWAIKARLFGEALDSKISRVDEGYAASGDLVPDSITQAILPEDQEIQVLQALLQSMPAKSVEKLPDTRQALESKLKARLDIAFARKQPYLLTTTHNSPPFIERYLRQLVKKWQNVMLVEIVPSHTAKIFSLQNEDRLEVYLTQFLEWKATLNDNT